MDIVIPTYTGHLEFLEKFLNTIDLNCLDKKEVKINLVVSKKEEEFFVPLIMKYPALNIIIMIMRDLVNKYDCEDIDEDKLLEQIGRFNYQSLKKLYGAIETGNEYVCLFDSECLFVREFKLKDYIDENKNKYYYCSKIETNKESEKTHAKYMQTCLNSIMNCKDTNWYLESYMWILRRDVLCDLKHYLINTLSKLTQFKKDFFIEYGYYLFYKMNNHKYPIVEWIDTNKVLKTYMPMDNFNIWYNNTHQWCMLEHIGLHLCGAKYDQIESVNYAYKQLKFPLYRLAVKDFMNQNMLLTCDDIKICVSEFCPEVYQLIVNGAFNKKIGIFVNGLFRDCDRLDTLLNFIYPLIFPIHYFVTSEASGLYPQLLKHHLTETFEIDNTRHNFKCDNIHSKYHFNSRVVQNTMSMLYKKSRLLEYVNEYDIIINMRPDLVSLDLKLVDILRQVLMHWDDNTLYVPKIYNSVGISDTFAIGSAKVMTSYLNLFDNITEMTEKNIFNPEYLLYKHIKNNDIKIAPISWNFKINHHCDGLSNAWWRLDAHDICDKYFEEYISLKTQSYYIIEKEFFKNNDKYEIFHKETNKKICITSANTTDSVSITKNPNDTTTFYISQPHDITIRINLKWTGVNNNLNHDGTGWNLFTTPDENKVFGYGNNGVWAQFYLIKEDDYYYFASYHTSTIRNNEKPFNRYLGISSGNLVCDLPKCDDAKWFIKIATI